MSSRIEGVVKPNTRGTWRLRVLSYPAGYRYELIATAIGNDVQRTIVGPAMLSMDMARKAGLARLRAYMGEPCLRNPS